LVAWYDTGYLAVDRRVFDVGIQTAEAIRSIIAGTPAAIAGSIDQFANGNGSLMRVLPLALWHQGSDVDLVDDAHRQSRVTHGHLRSQVCCALYCLWARRLLQQYNPNDAWKDAVSTLRQIYGESSEASAELEWQIRPDDEPTGMGNGYVVDCLRSARLAMQQNSFEDVIKTAIALGRDTDTTACVAGGLAGIYFGKQNIPKRWFDQLRGKELVLPLLQTLNEKLGL
jgi:ADP-ribosyl-[dinitrogen reductase] hydrolase